MRKVGRHLIRHRCKYIGGVAVVVIYILWSGNASMQEFLQRNNLFDEWLNE